MAIGDITELTPNLYAFELIASSTATNSEPSGASAGLSMNVISGTLGYVPSQMLLHVASTAGSGTMTVTIKLHGTVGLASNKWGGLGNGTDAGKGLINDGVALGENSTNSISHFEIVNFPRLLTRLYGEITAIGGTSTAITAWLIGGKAGRGDL